MSTTEPGSEQRFEEAFQGIGMTDYSDARVAWKAQDAHYIPQIKALKEEVERLCVSEKRANEYAEKADALLMASASDREKQLMLEINQANVKKSMDEVFQSMEGPLGEELKAAFEEQDKLEKQIDQLTADLEKANEQKAIWFTRYQKMVQGVKFLNDLDTGFLMADWKRDGATKDVPTPETQAIPPNIPAPQSTTPTKE